MSAGQETVRIHMSHDAYVALMRNATFPCALAGCDAIIDQLAVWSDDEIGGAVRCADATAEAVERFADAMRSVADRTRGWNDRTLLRGVAHGIQHEVDVIRRGKIMSDDMGATAGTAGHVLRLKKGQSFAIGDTVIVANANAELVVYAPDSTNLVPGEDLGISDVATFRSLVAEQNTGPYRVDGVPGYIRQFADAVQAAEIEHRDERLACVRDKYDNEVYRSQGGPS